MSYVLLLFSQPIGSYIFIGLYIMLYFFHIRRNLLTDRQTLGVITLLSHKSGSYRGQHFCGQKALSHQR